MNAVVLPLNPARRSRVALASLACLILVILALFHDTVTIMVEIWWNFETFTHAFLVAPLTIWMVWRERDALARRVPRPQPWLLLPIAIVGAAWLAGDLAIANIVTQLSLVTLIVLAVCAVYGLEIAWVIAFPLAFLYFAVPIGEFAIPTMMRWTADFTVYALQFSGIPVYREGQTFVIPTGTWSVVAACAGLRYLVASFMVGTLFAYLNYRSIKRRLIFMVIALLVPVIANWLRAYMIVMLGHLSNNRIAVGADHLIYGWIFFGVVVTIMFVIGAKWTEDATPLPPPAAASPPPQAPAADGRRGYGAPAIALAAALVLALPAAGSLLVHKRNRTALAPQLALPTTLAAGWNSEGAKLDVFKPTFVGAVAEADKVYASPAGAVGVYIGYYREQSPTSKFVTFQNWIVRPGDEIWNAIATRETRLETDSSAVEMPGVALLRRSNEAQDQRPRLEARRLYWVDGYWYGSDSMAKIANLAAQLEGHGDDAADLVLYTDGRDPALAQQLLQGFAADNFGTLDRLLRQTQARR